MPVSSWIELIGLSHWLVERLDVVHDADTTS